MSKEENKKQVKGLKQMRGKGELTHCSNCNCSRYAPCGCQKGEKKK
jgi:hypothetical protein